MLLSRKKVEITLIKDDQILQDSFERIFRVLDNEASNLTGIQSIYAEKVRQWKKEIRSYARIIEDISFPARLILEHVLELKYRAGQMAIDTENITQGFSVINDVMVEEFGVIKLSTGSIQLTWRDEDYNYLLYPDKVELRTVDEKAVIRLFFSHNFGRQQLHKYSSVINSPKLLYIHPVLQKHIDKNQK